MREKRNRKNTIIPTNGYVKKYFGNDIGRILTPSNHSFQNCEIPYVPHQEAEEVLGDCLIGDSYKDKSQVFTGLTGSGKTTILRHVFGLEKNANRPYIKENTIIIPVDFNRSHLSAKDAILSSLRAAVQMIIDAYEIDDPSVDNEKFFEYVKSRRPDGLYLNPQHNRATPYSERMAVFLEKMPRIFASCQLQYVMNQPECGLQMVLLVIDNIEAFMIPNAKDAKSRYLVPVIEAFRLAECIEQRGETTTWRFNMLISCRHHIWRIMKGEFTDNTQENALLQSYVTTENPYDLADPIKVDAIIEKREEVFLKKHKDPHKWNEAVKVVNAVLHAAENGISDFIMQLELKDLRKSMAKIQEIVLHKGLQKESDEEIVESGAFQIDSIDQFDLSRVNLIRILGIDNRKYYADSNSIIPNLLYNTQQEGMELYVLLTLKYFLDKCGNAEPAWDNSVSVPEFYETVRWVFGYGKNETDIPFEQAVCFLIQHRLLLRSADQPQNEVPGLSLEEVKRIEHVYVSGAAIKLWEELGESSALFQLFLDDVWMEKDSDYFEEDGNDVEHCVKYLDVLWKAEKSIYGEAENRQTKPVESYIKAFGVEPVCMRLLKGLRASLKTISESNDLMTKNRVEKAKDTLKKTEVFLSELEECQSERERIKDSLWSRTRVHNL